MLSISISRTSLRVIAALSLSLFAEHGSILGQSACSGQCPPCANNYASNLSGAHGKYQGRTIYNVYVDTTWGASQTAVANAAQTAMTAWNN